MSTLAERYATAVFELGVESGQLSQLTQQLRALADAYAASPELRSVLDNPRVEARHRSAILTDVAGRLGFGRIGLNTVRLLAQRRRLQLLPELARALVKLVDQRAGLLRATVTSAVPLSESYTRRMAAELQRATQRKVVLEQRLDPSLIAGVITRVADRTIDGSIQGRLAELERHLLVG